MFRVYFQIDRHQSTLSSLHEHSPQQRSPYPGLPMIRHNEQFFQPPNRSGMLHTQDARHVGNSNQPTVRFRHEYETARIVIEHTLHNVAQLRCAGLYSVLSHLCDKQIRHCVPV